MSTSVRYAYLWSTHFMVQPFLKIIFLLCGQPVCVCVCVSFARTQLFHSRVDGQSHSPNTVHTQSYAAYIETSDGLPLAMHVEHETFSVCFMPYSILCPKRAEKTAQPDKQAYKALLHNRCIITLRCTIVQFLFVLYLFAAVCGYPKRHCFQFMVDADFWFAVETRTMNRLCSRRNKRNRQLKMQ